MFTLDTFCILRHHTVTELAVKNCFFLPVPIETACNLFLGVAPIYRILQRDQVDSSLR